MGVPLPQGATLAIRQALRSLWNLLGRNERHLRKTITPDLFKALADPTAMAKVKKQEPWLTPDYSREVTKQLNKTEEVAGTWLAARNLGMTRRAPGRLLGRHEVPLRPGGREGH